MLCKNRVYLPLVPPEAVGVRFQPLSVLESASTTHVSIRGLVLIPSNYITPLPSSMVFRTSADK